jgi:hypothetical protein
MFAAFARRIFYGLFFEKKWQVSTAPASPELIPSVLADSAAWSTPALPKGYTFVADPFFSPDGIMVEALSRTGTGEILHYDGDGWRRLSEPGRHYSFPAMIEEAGELFVVPEISEWSAPKIFRVASGKLTEAAPMRVKGGPRIIDPVLFRHEGHLYLFGNVAAQGSNVLSLWTARSIFDEFAEHPQSPLRISPLGSRMAGAIVRSGQSLLRLGQDFSGAYGDGIFAFKVTAITSDRYSEEFHSEVRFADRRGPHTLNFKEGEAVFDWYFDKPAPLAWLRRLKLN